MRRKILFAALFVLPVLVLLPFLDRYPFHPGSTYSDLMVSHSPNAAWLRRALAEYGVLPLWSPAILGGYPFAANPLAGLFYPPGWLAVILPLPLGFNLGVILHLMWGAVGMCLLLRAEGLAESGALLGGLAFAAMPKLFAHLGAGHLTLLYAVPWTPWLLLAEHRARGTLAAPGANRALAYFLPGLALGIIFLADPRWGAYAALAWLAYAVFSARRDDLMRGRGIAPVLARIVSNLVTAAGAAAVVLLPLAEYTGLSTRASMGPGDFLIESLHPAQWLGLVYPYLRGPAESMLYPGGVVLALAVMGMFRARRKAPGWGAFWLWMILLTLLFALGRYFPPAAWLAGLPGFSLLRVPPRVLFLTGMAFAAAAAYGLDALLLAPRERGRAGAVPFALAALGVGLGASVAAAVDLPRVRLQFGWGAGVLLLAALVLAARRRLSPRWVVVGIFTLALADLNAVNALGLEYRTPCDSIADPSGAATYLSIHGGLEPYRIYSPSYSIPQEVAAAYGLELAGGVDPLILGRYQDFLAGASGIAPVGYSVTLPPFEEAPFTHHRQSVPDAARLGLLNVKYVASEFDLSADGLTLIAQKGSTRIYENQKALPRAWVQAAEAPTGQGVLSEAAVDWSPNRVRVEAQGPGLLVLSEVDYPGWSARVDGQAAEILPAAGLLRSVRLGAGRHEVIFSFAPATVFAGGAVSAVMWLGGAGWVLFAAWRKRASHRIG